MSSWATSYENQLADERGDKSDGLAEKTANLAVGDNAGGFAMSGFQPGAGVFAEAPPPQTSFGTPQRGFNPASNGSRGGFGFSNKAPSFGFGCARPANPGGFGSGFGPGANNADAEAQQQQQQMSPTKMGGQRNPFGRPQQQSPFGGAQQQQTSFGGQNGGGAQPMQQRPQPNPFGGQQAAFGGQRQPQNAFGGGLQAQQQQQQFVQTGAMRGGHQATPRFQQVQVQPPHVQQQMHQQQAQSQLPTRRSPIEEAGEKPMNPEDVALLNKFLHRTVKMMQDGKVDVHAQQRDPKSPLHSVLVFKELRLKDELLRALDLMGYHQPSKIQEFALPLLLMEPPTNMIAQSQSGTGKTAAFVLTMLSRVVPENQWPQCICLAPTYELAMQIGEVVNKMGRFLPDVKVHYAVRGTAKLPPGTMLKEQIIIGTPGRMIDYITKMRCFDASKIACLVLDEADVMIGQQGHLDLSHRIYNSIEAKAPSVQTMLFSATYDQAVMEFAEKLIKDAVSVTLKREDLTLNNIKQFYVECRDREAKYQAVCDLYSGLIIASSVVFTRTRSSASWLALRLREKGHEVALLHGDMTVQERAKAIEQFKDGVYKVLITTNVCSRGIDVSQVSIVINYDLPYYVERPDEPDYETYLHRIGRTGRFGKAGIAINFVDSIEDLALVQKLDNHFSRRIPKLDPGNIDELEAIEKEDF